MDGQGPKQVREDPNLKPQANMAPRPLSRANLNLMPPCPRQSKETGGHTRLSSFQRDPYLPTCLIE